MVAEGTPSIASAATLPAGDTIVVTWNQAVLQGVRDSKLGPPMVARALAIVHTCIFDAWAAYDPRAEGTRLGATLRRPRAERTEANNAKALSFAAYRAAVDLFPASTALFDGVMASAGYNATDTTADTSSPAGVGNVACRAVLDFRHNDGSNQLGTLNGGAPYSDYTGYQPVNAPMDIRAPFDPTTVRDPGRWQPLRFTDRTGATVAPGFIAPFWNRVTPFADRPPTSISLAFGPARPGEMAFQAQAQEALDLSADLTEKQKAMAGYWADGPKSELPPGHWDLFAQYVSRRDRHALDDDVKLFFAMTNAVFDAGIAAWNSKRTFDSVRPITAIRFLFAGQQVRAWAGPGLGTRMIDGATWMPYQPTWFPTPPFAEYTSGHSTFSAAAAEVLKRFTGSDSFGGSVTIAQGASVAEPGIAPAHDVRLSWPTFSAAADEAGMSRRYGGIHFAQGDLDGRRVGKVVGTEAWTTAQRYITGQ